jgi:hypothetical protein
MVLVLEVIGVITAHSEYNNSLFYNLLFVYVESCMFFYFFYLISESEKMKKLISILLVSFLLLGIMNSLFFQPLQWEFHNYSYAFASLAIIGLAIKFFKDVLRLDKYEERNLLSIPYFWIVTVILFFYSATFFYFVPLTLLYEINKSELEFLNFLIRLLAGLMYTVFGLAFYAPYIFREKY